MLPATPPDQSKFETIFVSIPIIDDGINENMNEVFAVIVELVDAVDSSRVNFSPRNASLCGIRDNDRKLGDTFVKVLSCKVYCSGLILLFFVFCSHTNWL